MTENDERRFREEIAMMRKELRGIHSCVQFIGWTVVLVAGVVLWPLIETYHLGPVIGVALVIVAVAYAVSSFSPSAPQSIHKAEQGGDQAAAAEE